MDWQADLKMLRAHLPRAREAWGVRGSLRWLEEAMRARGANPSSVRNIVYRDIGTAADKRALHGVLTELASELGRTLPPLPGSLRPALPAELELLGRQKRRAYRQFLAAVRQSEHGGRGARLVVSGPSGAGKNLLNTHLERALLQTGSVPTVRRLTLGGDVAALFSGPEFPGAEFPGPGSPGPGLGAGQPYAVQAEAQARAARRLLETLPGGGVLLLRVERTGEFGGVPPRGPDGAAVSLTAWAAEHLYRRAPEGLNVLLAAEDESALPGGLPGDHIRLLPPTPAEARRYLMAQLGLPAHRADELVRQTGRNLDRLVLLAAARTAGQGGHTGEDVLARLLADPAAVRLLSALATVLEVNGGGDGLHGGVPGAALEAALGQRLEELPAHVRALLDDADPAAPRPRSAILLAAARPLLPAAELKAALTRLAPGTAHDPALARLHLQALSRLGRWSELTRWLDAQPAGLALAPALWTEARGRVRGEAREALARSVVRWHAGLGAYGHPQARDALFALLDSPRDGVRAWARVKLAESSVEGGNFEAAEAQLGHPELSGPLQAGHVARTPDPWLQATQADALLVGAALARWRGDLEGATALAEDPRTLTGGHLSDPARAALWRGLIAKDAGRWSDAVRQLSQVPASHPLLSARARYQEGDLRLRLGQPAAALELLEGAARQLQQEGGAPEEQARVEARIATALRRLGHPRRALAHSGRATELAGEEADPVLQARLESERVPVLLALFRPDEALRAADRALTLLAQPGPRRAEAAYRERRTHYRVALAYLTRGSGQPYLPPFGGVTRSTPDIAQARQVLDRLLDLQNGGRDRERILTFDILLSRALAEPDAAQATGFAARALDMTDHPYTETQARATLADAHLRAGDAGQALHQINRAHALLRRVGAGPGHGGLAPETDAQAREPDPGLSALLLTLEARCALQDDPAQAKATLGWLAEATAAAPLRPFRAQVWREIGGRLEELAGGQEAALALFPGLHPGVLRLRDALGLAASAEERPARCGVAPVR